MGNYASFCKQPPRPDLFWRIATDNQQDSIDEQFRDLLNKMFALDYNQRISVEDALAHDWMQQEDNFDIDAFK